LVVWKKTYIFATLFFKGHLKERIKLCCHDSKDLRKISTEGPQKNTKRKFEEGEKKPLYNERKFRIVTPEVS